MNQLHILHFGLEVKAVGTSMLLHHELSRWSDSLDICLYNCIIFNRLSLLKW